MTVFLVAKEKTCYLQVTIFVAVPVSAAWSSGCTNPPTFANPMRATGALPDADEAWIFSESHWRGLQIKINAYRSVTLGVLTDPELTSTWQTPVMKVGLTPLPRIPGSWDGFIPPHPLVAALVSAGISLGKCLSLPGSSGRMGVYAFCIKPQWCLAIRQNIWVLVPKARESPSTEGKERGWWLVRGIYSLGRVQSCPDIPLEGENFPVLVPLCLDLREKPDVHFSLFFVAATWQDTSPTLLEWPLPLVRHLAAVPGFAEGYLTNISPFQCFSFLSRSHYNAAVLRKVWGAPNCSHQGNPTVSWMSQPPWWIRYMEYKKAALQGTGMGHW